MQILRPLNVTAIALVAIVCAVTALSSHAEDVSPKTKALIDTIINLNGSVRIGEAVSNAYTQQICALLKQNNPQIEARAFEIVEEQVKSVVQDQIHNKGLINQVSYASYGKRFSNDELGEIIAFYKTPTGQKLVQALPAIAEENAEQARLIGEGLGNLVSDRVLESLAKAGIRIN